MIFQLDHLVVAASSLDEGAEWVADRLDVLPGPGGSHAAMGTHNRLLALGSGAYLEVIAVDPESPPPGRTRWFGLDSFKGPPRLVAWVARTANLDGALAAAPDGTGAAMSLSRGPYRWRLSVPDDGRLPFDGVAPALIEWEGDAHPCDALPASRSRLVRLNVSHPSPLVTRLPAVERVRYLTGAPSLRAVVETARGPVELA